jgi:hypothetical protein
MIATVFNPATGHHSRFQVVGGGTSAAPAAFVAPGASQVAKRGISGRRHHLDALIAEHGGENRVVSVVDWGTRFVGGAA